MARALERAPGLGYGDPTLQAPAADVNAATSSTQSLLAPLDGDEGKRKLLVVYIHGFMGNNSSFHSFPAHVHNFLKDLLAETHVIHSKIYPRYKTYHSIHVARDNFSNWLAPHESPTTDVVLVGHSMGGLLAAEVVLLPSHHPYSTSSPFRHRILGVVSLDAPFLGLHPGIVVSGIASLFRPAPTPPAGDGDTESGTLGHGQLRGFSPDPDIYAELSPPSRAPSHTLSPCPSSSTVSSSDPAPPDPLFDPPFFNDAAFVDRGWFKNIVHFARKHKAENLVHAAANHILSHLEFSKCLADYPGLRSRYSQLRRLEDVDEWRQSGNGEKLVRVRFVNYYTVSTGLPKRAKGGLLHGPWKHTDGPEDASRGAPDTDSLVPTPRISVEYYSEGQRCGSLQELEPMPEPEPFEPLTTAESSEPEIHSDPPSRQHDGPNLPPIPDVPPPPSPLSLDLYPDKEARKQAKKAFKLAEKAHSQAVKARQKAIKDRQNALDKQRRKAGREHKPAKLEQESPSPSLAKHKDLHHATNQAAPQQQQRQQQQEEEDEGQEREGPKQTKPTATPPPPRRLRKFCLLPPPSSLSPSPSPSASPSPSPSSSQTHTHTHDDGSSGSGGGGSSSSTDPACWVPVHMEGVDEVGAHCGLFVAGRPHYERLVGDVGERVAAWVGEDASRRVVQVCAAAGVD